MSYRNNKIPNLRTIKALRGESLTIDLGIEFEGTLASWMKRSPNDDSYRSFEIQDGRYLYLSADKASDYVVDDVVVEAIAGKWYFDVEQDLQDGSDKRTIYRGTILFQDDITNSNGTEGTPPPSSVYKTPDILTYDGTESPSGTAANQYQANREFTNEINTIKDGLSLASDFRFDDTINGNPTAGYITFDAAEFVDVSGMKINTLDSTLFDIAYKVGSLGVGDFITIGGGASTIAIQLDAIPTLNGNHFEISGIPVSFQGPMFILDKATILSCFKNSTSGSGSANLEEDVDVVGVTVGNVSDGDVLPEGQSFTDTMKQIMQKTIPPTYTQPTVGLSINPSSTQEIGSTNNIILTPSFSQNDAGSINQVVFKRGGTIIHTQSGLGSYTDMSQVTQAGSNSYSVEISYDQGPIKDDNFGNPYPSGRIEAGTKVSSKSYSGSYRNWFGPNGNSEPADGNEIRGLGFVYSNSFTLNTGNSDKVMVISIPATKNLSSVIDADALNANITSSYILSGTLTTVPDGGGNNVSYKTYILTIAQAYSSNHRHNITIG